ncbi:MAG: threonine/serine exporter family protein [Lachnospiraceae bacterium]
MITQFIVSLLATLSFAVLFSVEKKQLLFCGLTGAIGWIVYMLCIGHDASNAIADLIATLTLTLVARVLSAVRRTPVTIYLLTGIFPLVPGAGIYYTSYYFIMGDMSRFTQYGISTIKVAGSIVLGIIFGFALPQSLFNRLSEMIHKDSPIP